MSFRKPFAVGSIQRMIIGLVYITLATGIVFVFLYPSSNFNNSFLMKIKSNI